jgi:hypothetical protein
MRVSASLIQWFREAIAQLESRLLERPATPKIKATEITPAFILPYAGNLDFVERQNIFNDLKECLFQDGTQSHQPKAALWGLGGAG